MTTTGTATVIPRSNAALCARDKRPTTLSRPSAGLVLRVGACILVVAVGAIVAFIVAPDVVAQVPRRPPDVPALSFDVLPGDHFGPIRETTARQTLVAWAAVHPVVDSELSIGEGFCTPGVRAFAGTPNELEIAWQDAAATRVAFVRARLPGGRWRTARGVSVGVRLRQLEAIAGRVLTFSGFGWDYGGGLIWAEGQGELGLRLTIASSNSTDSAASSSDDIYGDRIVRSDHASVRALDIRIVEMTQSWGAQSTEHDCR